MGFMVKEFSNLENYDGWFGSTLKKLPMWGNRDYEPNFEWPTEEAWTSMDHNLSLTSIDFSSKDDYEYRLASVEVNYSDGDSKLFENINPSSGKAWDTFNYESFDLNASQIRAV